METVKGKDNQQYTGLLTRSITRRQAIKAGGIAVVGLAFSKPLIETVLPKPAFANYVTRGAGCTPGYWRQEQHFHSWAEAGYSPTDLFSAASIFDREITVDDGGGSTITNPTLLEAVWATNGGISALARHAVAALLNSAHPAVDYAFTTLEVIQKVQVAIDSGNAGQIEATKNELDGANNQGCTLN